MIISHEKKFIFFACGKTGTTSIEKILKPYHQETELDLKVGYELYLLRQEHNKPFNPKHVLPSLVKKHMTEEEWNSYFKFVFVRNPWDWLLANFCYNFRFLSQFLKKFDKEHFDAIWYFLKFHNQSLGSENYFQYNFAFDNGKQIVDYIGRFETLQDDFDEICRKISIPVQKLPHDNRTEHLDYNTLYTPEALEMVRNKFEQDIVLFDYKF